MNVLKKKYDPHIFCISKITDSENVVRTMPKKSHFRGPLYKQHGKHAPALLKSPWHHLYQIHWSLSSQWRWKKSLLLTCKILGLLVNTLAAEENYPVLNRNNLMIPIQMKISQKRRLFLNFLLHFWNLPEILNVLKKRMTLIAFVFRKLLTRKT